MLLGQRIKNSVITVFAATLVFFASSVQAAPYQYTNETYGFTIECPERPIGVLPLADASPEETGVILVFGNEGYNLTHAWAVSIDGFNEEDLPDLDKLSKEKTDDLLEKMMNGNYELATVVKVDGKKALYAVTKGEHKKVVTYIRGKKNRYAVALIENPEITKEKVNTYQKGVMTFKSK